MWAVLCLPLSQDHCTSPFGMSYTNYKVDKQTMHIRRQISKAMASAMHTEGDTHPTILYHHHVWAFIPPLCRPAWGIFYKNHDEIAYGHGNKLKLPERIWLEKRDVLWSNEPHCCWEGQRHLRQKDTFSSDLGEIASTTWGNRIALDDYCIGIRYTLADMPSDPHLKGQTHILASQTAFSCWKFELPLMEWPAF